MALTLPYWIDGVAPGRLGIMPRPRGGDWLVDELRRLREAGVDLLVSLLTDEEAAHLGLDEQSDLCAGAGLAFARLPIRDLGTPAAIEPALTLARDIASRVGAGGSVVIHCRGGIGRSSIIAACVLAVSGAPIEDAFARITAARGVPTPELRSQYLWAETFARLHGS